MGRGGVDSGIFFAAKTEIYRKLKKDNMKKDGMKHDSMKKDDMTKGDVSKDKPPN